MNIIQAILRGERNSRMLANLSVGASRKNIDIIAKALEGNYRSEHLFSLQQAHEAYQFFHRQIYKCEEVIEKLLPSLQVESPQSASEGNPSCASPSPKKRARKTIANRSPYYFNARDALQRITVAELTTIPGIDANTAMKILSEIGTDTSQWANAKAFASWLGLCPGNKISGGKVLSSRTKPSDNRVAQALRMAASTLYRSKTALGAFFRRMRARLGAPKAITATAHKLARILYRMLANGENFRESGENYYEQQYQARVIANLTKRAKEFGYVLTPVS